jgi:hypothetical protein
MIDRWQGGAQQLLVPDTGQAISAGGSGIQNRPVRPKVCLFLAANVAGERMKPHSRDVATLNVTVIDPSGGAISQARVAFRDEEKNQRIVRISDLRLGTDSTEIAFST